MKDIERQIAQRVETFVAELSDLLRKAALQNAADILAKQAEAPGPSHRRRRARRAARRDLRERRSPAQIDQLATRVEAEVASQPGRRVDQIAKDLGVTTRDLKLPVKKLLAEKRITRTGQRRATCYFPAGKRKRKK